MPKPGRWRPSIDEVTMSHAQGFPGRTSSVRGAFASSGRHKRHMGPIVRRPLGNDINPLSVLLTRPRLKPPTLPDIARRLGQVPWHTGTIDNPDLLVFFSEKTLRHICALRNWLLDRAPLGGTADPVDDWI